VGKNTSQAASVEFVRHKRTNNARSRLQKLAENPEGVFRQAQAAPYERVPLFACHTLRLCRRLFIRVFIKMPKAHFIQPQQLRLMA